MHEDIYEILDNLSGKGSRFGTDRERALLDAVGSPDEGLKIIHVAGTNGKGSTCAYLSNIFLVAGICVGTYLSPYVVKREECYLLNGKPVSEKKLKVVLSEVYDISLSRGINASAFEIETAAAFLLFYREDTEYAVIETGLGGKEDATNAIQGKVAAVITSISLEHTSVLGHSIKEICAQKAGIINECPAVITKLQPDEAICFFDDYVSSYSGEDMEILSMDTDGETFSYRGEMYKISLFGKEQCYNAALAIDVAKMLSVEPFAIMEGLKITRLFGRCEKISLPGRTYILDGSHNPGSFAPLCDLLDMYEGGKTIIYGALSDKDVLSCADMICRHADRFIAVKPPSLRAMGLEKITKALEAKCEKVLKASSIYEALKRADTPVVAVCGSFTLLKEANNWIETKQ